MTEKIEGADDKAMMKAHRKGVLRVLCGVGWLHFCSVMMLVEAKMVIYSKRFQGDTASIARMNARGMSTMMSLGMFVSPLLGVLSDILGRKTLLLLGPMWSLALRLLEVAAPTARTSLLTTSLSSVASAGMLGTKTAIMDLFPDDPRGAGAATALYMVGPLIGSIVGPLLGSATASRGVRWSFVTCASILVTEIALTWRLVPETLPESRRTPLADVKWRQAVNPLQFLKLFVHGPQLALLALAQFLADLASPFVVMSMGSLLQTETLGWSVAERGRFQSAQAVCALPGYILASEAVKRLGNSGALLLGSGATLMGHLLNGLWVRKAWQQVAILPMASPTGCSMAAMQGAIVRAAADCRNAAGEPILGKAELQAALANLSTIATVIAFPLWASVCGRCIRAGKPRRFYSLAAVVTLTHIVIAMAGLSEERRIKALEESAAAGKSERVAVAR
eukprot:TRINITY_DN36509_c0_g1_i1.p1 TRINITY_DN36509_c0_g1~~TRINITY_DN36509_c0_g1_i1.p1  ORF type:complete len:450 (-),score=76.18 TRINITY_DN36509_c0_g1_i1:489-1838(-)